MWESSQQLQEVSIQRHDEPKDSSSAKLQLQITVTLLTVPAVFKKDVSDSDQNCSANFTFTKH